MQVVSQPGELSTELCGRCTNRKVCVSPGLFYDAYCQVKHSMVYTTRTVLLSC